MAFSVSDFEDLERLLAEHPEWRARLRPLILGDEILEVPRRLDRIEAILERMVSRQDTLEQRMDAFERRQEAFEERMVRLEERMAELVGEVTELARIAREHELRLNRMDGRMGNIEGQLLEDRYHKHLRNWFRQYLVKPEIVYIDDLTKLQAAVAAGSVAAAEVERLQDVDILVRGLARNGDAEELILAVEVSQTVNLEDLERASEHALTLRRAGYTARGVVGGYRLAPGLDVRAEELGVLVDLRRAAA